MRTGDTMKRTTRKRREELPKKASAILTGDWHLREDTPLCRTDSCYWDEQWRKVEFVSALQAKHECPVLHSGDLFNHWKPSPYLLTKTIEYLPQNFWTIYGNHDLPQNNIEMREKSGIEVLDRTQVLEVLSGYHWNQSLPNGIIRPDGLNMFQRKVIVWHVMVWQGKLPWPGCTDPEAGKLLKDTEGTDLILTGHNHKPFVAERNGRLLVNPGSLMRMSADQIEHKPRIYLWYENSNTVEPVYIPIDPSGVSSVSRAHLEQSLEKDARIEAFIEKLNMDWSSEVSFRKNLDLFFANNDVPKNVQNLIWKSLEKET
jgi:DNA repair exonuclease SbcCD nuclease subunit